jgi:osmotically-inducible protein OsmY
LAPFSARLALAACLLLANAGCAGFYVGVAATGGVMALQERGLDGAGDDIAIRTQINQLWFEHDHEMHMRLTLQVWDRRVLVAGVLPEPAQRETALALARSAGGVREVIDGIETGTVRDLGRYTSDKQIEKDIELRLFFTRDIDSINYSVQVVNGGVFLLGTAQDAAELSRVLAVVRDVGGVRRIANHVLLREEARRLRTAAASP